MAAGTKAETVIAILLKNPHKHRNQVTEINSYGNMAHSLPGNVFFQMQLVLSTDSTFKPSFRSSARNKNQHRWQARSGK
jgi:hypothetical protein